MAVSSVGELASKYPRWNLSVIGVYSADKIPLGSANAEDLYVCRAVNNPNVATVYTTPAYQTPLEAANEMDRILSGVLELTKFASVMGKLQIQANVFVWKAHIGHPPVG